MLEIKGCLPLSGDDLPLAWPFTAVLNPGQSLKLSGANGAGKTSILNAVAGILHHHGMVSLDGVPFTRQMRVQEFLMPRVDFQSLRHWYVYEYINFIERHSHSAMSFPCPFDRRKKINQLSRGQKQFLNLCLLNVSTHKVWCLDEIDNYLDANVFDLFTSLCLTFLSQGGVIILASHHDVSSITTQEYLVGDGVFIDA